MGYVSNFVGGIIKAVPVVLAKIGTIILLIFTVGMFAGYLIASAGISPLLLLVPVIAMVVMWYKLDEGVLFMLLLAIAVLAFPSAVESLLQAIL
ncbi:MAG: hypothetical protein NTW59_04055 [Candidatus Diapherotrites archaeon]|nr:hypothetical protein [Candidatus Diapherotrites archaeon]